MAATFCDLHTEAGLKHLNEFLSIKTYISGDMLSKDDIRVYAAVLKAPSGEFPNVCRWYEFVSSSLWARNQDKDLNEIVVPSDLNMIRFIQNVGFRADLSILKLQEYEVECIDSCTLCPKHVKPRGSLKLVPVSPTFATFPDGRLYVVDIGDEV